MSWCATPPGLRFQARSRANMPINAKTPTESSLDRRQPGPEQGSTSVSVAHAKMLAFRMEATPPTHNGSAERPRLPNNQSVDDNITVPPTKNRTPKIIKGADCAAHSRRIIMPPTMTGTSP
jgi:hypothetical protein